MIRPEQMDIEGILTINEFSKETGELLYTYEDTNVITELGMNTLFLRMVKPDANTTMKLKNFFLGIDYGLEEDTGGGWTVFNPRPALKTYTSLNQYKVYEVPAADMVFDYPDANSFQVGTLLDGKYILDAFFPEEVDLRYTSSTFRFENDTTFSYKRFPVRSLSRLIDVQIVWTFRFVNATDYICPLPDYEALINVYSVENGSLQRYADDMVRTEVSSLTGIVDAKVRPNGDIFFVDSNNQLRVLTENLSSSIDRALTASDVVHSFDLDQSANILALLNNSSVAKYNSAGDQQWEVSVGAGSPYSIWAIDNTRIAVSLEDTTSDSLTLSDNRVYVISSETGSILYTGIYDNGFGKTGQYDLFSSSGGELFVVQYVSGGANNLIKVNYDLTEISRVSLDGVPTAFYSIHDNFILVAVGSTVTQYDADLNFIGDFTAPSNIIGLSVDRERDLYVAMSDTIHKTNLLGEVLESSATTGLPSSISAVGSKWSYFGS